MTFKNYLSVILFSFFFVACTEKETQQDIGVQELETQVNLEPITYDASLFENVSLSHDLKIMDLEEMRLKYKQNMATTRNGHCDNLFFALEQLRWIHDGGCQEQFSVEYCLYLNSYWVISLWLAGHDCNHEDFCTNCELFIQRANEHLNTLTINNYHPIYLNSIQGLIDSLEENCADCPE